MLEHAVFLQLRYNTKWYEGKRNLSTVIYLDFPLTTVAKCCFLNCSLMVILNIHSYNTVVTFGKLSAKPEVKISVGQ